MTTNALGVVGVDITPHCFLVFLDAEYGVLRTIDDAVVALEAHTAAHATTRLGNGLLIAEASGALREMIQHLVCRRHVFFTQIAECVCEVPQE